MAQKIQGGTILIVEDEPLIAQAVREVLAEAGFPVLVTDDADQALAVLEQGRAREFAGLVTDIKLGGSKNGWDIAARAREMNPALPVVYMSGDSTGDWAAHGVPRSAVLEKPFAVAQVVVALGSLLNRTDLDR